MILAFIQTFLSEEVDGRRQARREKDGASGNTLKKLLTPAKSRESKLADVVSAIVEASPYLWDLIRAEPDRFLNLLHADPDARFTALIADAQHAGLHANDDAEVMHGLRRAKAEAALLIAL